MEKRPYIPPTGDELAQLLKEHKLTFSQAAALIDVSEDDIRNHIWGARPLPHAAWRRLDNRLAKL